MFKLVDATTSCRFAWFRKDVVSSRQTVKKELLRSGHTNELKNLCFYISRSQRKDSGNCNMCIFGWTTITNYESNGVLVCFFVLLPLSIVSLFGSAYWRGRHWNLIVLYFWSHASITLYVFSDFTSAGGAFLWPYSLQTANILKRAHN